MSSLEDVSRSLCRIVTANGQLCGTGFFVLPDGHALTCHHVVFGQPEILVQVPSESALRRAEYLANESNPEADIAVLRVSGPAPPAVQLGRSRPAARAYGFGFRPATVDAEPEGHTFAGRLTRGQTLRIRPANRGLPAPVAEQPWNTLPSEYRTGAVLNFDLAHGVAPGISGGPVYDPERRRVTGIFRAVEGEQQAYVLPLDAVFDGNWPELEGINRRDVRDSALDPLSRQFDIGRVDEGAAPVEPVVEDHLAALLRDYAMFGGRAHELQQLMDFVRSDDGGYFFVTGPPLGYGKTALLVAMTRALSNGDPPPVVHFLNRNYSTWVGWESCLDNLSRQLLKIHGLGGPIPKREPQLRKLYRELLMLSPPAGRKVVVILDGLDEAVEWSIGPDLFPGDLPSNVKVIFAAQYVADRDWLSDLKLSISGNRILPIERLSAADVFDIVQQSGLKVADAAAATARLFDLSDGDAFHLIELLRDLDDNRGDLARLGARSTPSEYLRTWWDTVAVSAGHDAFYDLMGTLALAVAPLGTDEIVDVRTDDALTGRNIGRVLRDASRYVTGNHRDGYQLKHARIRRFVVDTMRGEIAAYADALTRFCLNWSSAERGERSRAYVLESGVRQLIDLGRTAEVDQLLSGEFIAASWQHLRSFSGYIRDASLAATAVYAQGRSETPRALGLAVARQTMRDATSQIPPDVFRVWIRLGDAARALSAADLIPEARGAASEHLLAMAAELLSTADDPAAAGEERRSEVALRLLHRTAGMIPNVRLPFIRFERFRQMTETVATAPGSTATHQIEMAEQSSRWGESIADPLERAYVLGEAAYLYAVAGDRTSAEAALDRSERASRSVTLEADRLMLWAARINALRVLHPQRPLDESCPGFEPLTRFDGTFPLPHASPCRYVADALADAGALGRPLLRSLAAFVTANARPYDVRCVVNALLRTGDIEEAVRIIESAAVDPATFVMMASGLEHLGLLRTYGDRPWWQFAVNSAAPDALFAAGESAAALARLRGIVGANDRVRAIAALLKEVDGAHQLSMDAWNELATLIAEIPSPQSRSQCLAAAAVAAFADPARAARLLDEALCTAMTGSIHDSFDALRSLHAVALHHEGRHDDAIRATEQIDRVDLASSTYIALIDATGPGDRATVDLYARNLVARLRAAELKDPTSGFYETAIANALALAARNREAGTIVYEHVAGRQVATARTAIARAIAGYELDPGIGRRLVDALIERTRREPPDARLEIIAALLPQLARVEAVAAGGAAEELMAAGDRALENIEVPDSRQVRIAAARAAMMMRHAPDAALTELETALGLVARPRRLSQAEAAAQRFIVTSGMYAHGPAAQKMDQADDLVRIWTATLPALRDRPTEAVALLGRVLASVADLQSSADESTALARMIAAAAAVPAPDRDLVAARLDEAIDRAVAVGRDDYQAWALGSAVRSLLAAGDLARAQRAAGQVRSNDGANRVESIVESARERTSALSPVERHLITLLPKDNYAFFSVYYMPTEEAAAQYADSMIESVVRESGVFEKGLTRSRLLELVLSDCCLLHRTGGAAVIGRVIDAIRDHDARFERAGLIIAARRTEGAAMA